MEIQDIDDEYQISMQRTEEDDEYFNSSLSVTESSLTKSTTNNNKSDSALVVVFNDNKFKCCFGNCKKDYFDDECEECKNHGEENNFFCLEHKDHFVHHKKSITLLLNDEIDMVAKNNPDDNNEDLDISLCVGNANQQYIFNLLKCITEVR